MTQAQRRVVATVMLGHFIAAFAALGMPPFFALILSRSLHSDALYLAGWLYVVPTLVMALSSSWWGRLADRFGKRPLLLRAQLGLAGSFLLAGFADSPAMFFVALALQGLLGGTFAASNAYLATVVGGSALTRSLTLMQGSARAALIVAPVVLGLFVGMGSPIELYRYLALLPLAAALLIWRLPEWTGTPAAQAAARATGSPGESVAAQHIYVLQFVFVLATVMTFPYFVSFAQQHSAGLSASMAGLLFGLPHLVYLVIAAPLSARLGQRRLAALALAFAGLAIALVGQALAQSLWGLAWWRVAMGVAMTLGFVALHGLVAAMVHAGNAGKTFGWLESGSKWGAVLAGLLAGLGVQALDLRAPFLLGAGLIASAAVYLLVLNLYRQRTLATD